MRAIGIIILGLLLSGCFPTLVGNNSNLYEENKYLAVTNLSSHGVVDGFITGITLGAVSPKLYKFYAYSNSQIEAEKKSMQECKNFAKKKGWEKNISCRLIQSKLSVAWGRKKRAVAKASDLTFTIKDKKEQCKTIGFEPATEKFADCVLRLVELDVSSQQQKKIALAESQGNQQIADELRKQRKAQSSRYLMELGKQLSTPKAPASLPSTRTCTISGSGANKTVSCW